MTPPRAPKHAALLFALSTALGCAATPPAASPRPSNPQPGTPPVFALAAKMAQRPDDPADKGVASRITKVTVYSDRALVSREATAALTAAPVVLRFKRLPGWVDEGSVRAATSAGRSWMSRWSGAS